MGAPRRQEQPREDTAHSQPLEAWAVGGVQALGGDRPSGLRATQGASAQGTASSGHPVGPIPK